MSAYYPILVLAIIAVGFAIISMAGAITAGPKRYNRAKVQSYECGIEPTPQAIDGGKFSLKFYMTAMLFIVFDIEIVFLYPWAVTFDALGWFGLVASLSFLVLITVPFVYEWRRGGLEWD
jgi:NADH-quinone oxidoreductase subunit A